HRDGTSIRGETRQRDGVRLADVDRTGRARDELRDGRVERNRAGCGGGEDVAAELAARGGDRGGGSEGDVGGTGGDGVGVDVAGGGRQRDVAAVRREAGGGDRAAGVYRNGAGIRG